MAEPGMGPELEPERGPEAVTAEAVLRELRLFELRCEGEQVPDKLVELCLSHGLGPVALANELLAFVTSKDLDLQLTPEGLDAFEHEGSHKRSNSTPETPQAKRAPPSRSPLGLFSPSSFSPSVTPSQKYSSRTGRGEAVAAFGAVQGQAWLGTAGTDGTAGRDGTAGGTGAGTDGGTAGGTAGGTGGGTGGSGSVGVTVRAFGSPEQLLSQPYKFMFQKLLDVREGGQGHTGGGGAGDIGGTPSLGGVRGWGQGSGVGVRGGLVTSRSCPAQGGSGIGLGSGSEVRGHFLPRGQRSGVVC
uniref:DNA polymerase alpha subunit B N-terminal domain-containing protein n=1 Tax=Junco hyemalis TaxID=40217 RepID=A0A8C5IUF2_JUNHY